MREAIVVVTVWPQHDELLLVAHVEGGGTVTWPLGDLGQREADLPHSPDEIGLQRIRADRVAVVATMGLA